MERMLNFFRRSKREKNHNSRDPPDYVANTNMCKNTPTEKLEIAPENISVQRNSQHSEVATLSTNDRETKMSEKFPPTISYASAVKKSDKVRSGVKPCGHGTLAIAPRAPVSSNKRENTSTPSSPVLESKRPFKYRGSASDTFDINKSKISRSDSKDKDSDNDNDTVSASMKLALNLPFSGSISTLSGLSTDSGLLSGSPEAEKKNLINQEAKFQSQLNELSKQLSIRDAEANKLRFQMDELQRDVFAKSAGMDRLQAELQAAYKESDLVKIRLKHLENDLQEFREKNSELSEDLTDKAELYAKYEEETNTKIEQLESLVRELEDKIKILELQLETIKNEKENMEKLHAAQLNEKEEEKSKLAATLEQTLQHKKDIEKKWNEDFEKLRTINILKEQQLLDDFEWKLREIQQKCKKRLEEKDRTIAEKLQEAYRSTEIKIKEAEELMKRVDELRKIEKEAEKLRGLTVEQEKAMKQLEDQHEQMKVTEASLQNEAKRLRNMIEMEKENLQHIQRLHHQELQDKERKLNQTLYQKRNEIAMYWEEKLIHECGRLKNELEQIHNEEKFFAMETVRREKDEEFERCKAEWEKKLKDKFREVESLKKSMTEREEYYHDEIERTQTNTDRDILELRRLMDKIDMTHHEKFEQLVQQHEVELERINLETENRIKEIEQSWQSQVTSLRTTVELVKEQMERDSQQKIEDLIQQHRSELDSQWQNLIHQKNEAIKLVEDEYVMKYRNLEEQFYMQQKSHGQREKELLKTIDSLKNELDSKTSTIDDLQNNIETLEGGIQVLNEEVAQQDREMIKIKKESEQKLRGLQETITKLHKKQEDEREAFRLKLMSVQKQSHETIEHLQRKCNCLTKLFEEVRQRYERRESRQEDLNIISDLRQVIAEQEKDLACLNEEKRYFQMRLISLERQLEGPESEEEPYEDAQPHGRGFQGDIVAPEGYSQGNMTLGKGYSQENLSQAAGNLAPPYHSGGNMFTIPECDE